MIGHLDAIPERASSMPWTGGVGLDPGGGVEVKCVNSMATGNVLRLLSRCSGDSINWGARLLVAVCISVIKGSVTCWL